MAVDRVGRHTGSWSNIQGFTHNHENEGKTINLGWMLYSVHACTRCMLYLVYAGLGVNSWSWPGEIERDDLTVFSAMMVELWTRKREMRTMWTIREELTNQGYDWPDWVVKTSYRRNYTLDRKLYLLYLGWYIISHTKISKSQFLMMICPISSYLSCRQLYHHLRNRS